MSAREDASHESPVHPPGDWLRPAAALLLGAFLGAGIVGGLAEHLAPDRLPRYEAEIVWQGGPPAAAEWPRPPRPGELARPAERAGSSWLVVRSFTAAGTETLARALERRRLSDLDASAARRDAAGSRWRTARGSAPPPLLTPAARCAAQLRARLLLGTLAVGPAVTPPADIAIAEREGLVRAEVEVIRLALVTQPDSLGSALTACAAAEDAWLKALARPARQPGAGSPSVAPARLAEAWADHEQKFGFVLEVAASRIESDLPPALRADVGTAALDEALARERQTPDPAAVLFASGDWSQRPDVSPVPRTWALLFGAGGIAGGLIGLGLGLAEAHRTRGSRRRRAPRRERLAREAGRAWESDLARLHVVSGPDSGRVGDALELLVGAFLERGESVLVVDAGKRLRLHERFGGESGWGLGECLAAEMPLLGAVQATGRPRFHFLGHGSSSRAERWDGLSRVLEEAHAHFDRVLLAIDPRAPREAALPLGGRVLEAWWASPGSELPRSALALGERLGIGFAAMDLSVFPEAMREASAGARPDLEVAGPEAVPRVGGGAPATSEEAGAGTAPSQAGTPEAAAIASAFEAGADASASPLEEPLVLDCDLEVRERLRFLLWMRRLQAESRATALESRGGGRTA
jgi:hypothetical protein